MFYYNQEIPTKGTVLIGDLINDEENEYCLYVKLPEYNNIKGIIHKSELPKKFKLYKKSLSDMKQSGTVVCMVSSTPVINNKTNNIDIVELTITGIDHKFYSGIIKRVRNIEKIIRLILFLSQKTNIDYHLLMKEFYKKMVTPLIWSDDIESINDLDGEYDDLLRSRKYLLECLGSSNDTESKSSINGSNLTEINKLLDTIIKETNGSSTMDFDITIWKAKNKDPINVLREVFDHIKNEFKNIDIRYIGSPRYQILLSNIRSDMIDNTYTNIHQEMNKWFKSNMVIGYDLQFDMNTKKNINGDVSVVFPYKIDLINK